MQGFGMNVEFQLAGESDGAHHPEWVIAEGHQWVAGRADELLLQVVPAAKGVYQSAIVIRVQADGEGIDGEVAPQLVILEGARYHFGVAAVGLVAFLSRANKFKVEALRKAKVRGAIGLK